MMRIGYGDETLLVGDGTAKALMTLAALEAESASARSVHLTVIDAAGANREVDLLIGPATMMTTTSQPSTLDEPDNREFEAIVEAIITSRGTPVPSERSSPVDTAIDEI